MMNNQPQQLDPESLSQLPIEVLVKIIIQQVLERLRGLNTLLRKLTVVQTCRRQGSSGIDFFAQALLADSNDYPSRPSLLPKFET